MHPSVLRSLAATLALSAAACGSASGEGVLCAAPGACEAGLACVAARCRPTDVPVTPPDSVRVVLRPADVAVVSARGSDDGAPEAIAFGSSAKGATVVLLRFEASWRDDAEITSAFLVLDPIDGAPPARDPMTIEAARILEPWSSETATWGRQPRLAMPEVVGVLRARPSGRLRFDVTRWVRDWAKRRRDDHGIALVAKGDDVYGASYSSGLARGGGPRLEAYVR